MRISLLPALLLTALIAGAPLNAAKKQGAGKKSGASFKQLDRDRSGKLSIKELWPAVKGTLNVEQTKKLFKALDRNNDDEIEELEFKRLAKYVKWIKQGKDPAEEQRKKKKKKKK
ncbi:MAG: EF-hand domain-containing protein [Phycisphaeraceae bacterium]|nr:EF-hand domain-containing protein [Phycisphaeraceae bacterium]